MQRIKIKQKPFFENFEFNKLNDFQLEPPFKPEKKDMKKYFQENNPYESILKEEKESRILSTNKKRLNKYDEYEDEEGEDSDYDPNWVEVF